MKKKNKEITSLKLEIEGLSCCTFGETQEPLWSCELINKEISCWNCVNVRKPNQEINGVDRVFKTVEVVWWTLAFVGATLDLNL